ncbi:MAG: hypothetical protein QOG32_437, partial [Chloroflexota bacterium]|nr:hypothetical protein [Chloroflexota bacterium]
MLPASARLTGRLVGANDAVDRVLDARARGILATWGLIVTFVLVTAERLLGAASLGTFAIDLRIYRAAAEAALHGGNPWLAGVAGLTFAGPPPTLLPYLPAALLPESLAIALYGAINVGAALIALRSLRLPIWWLLFPPISDSLIVLNPDVVVIALLIGVPRLASVAVPIKIYAVIPLALTARWRALAVGLLICALSLPWWSAFFEVLPSIEASLAAQSFGGASAWGSWLMVPTVLALVFLRKRGAEWLTVPAIWPYTQLHYAALALPIAAADAVVAFLLSFPVLYLVPVATISYALRLLVRDRLATYRSGA